MLGIESTGAVAARRDAEGKAIGAGCRHSARSVEDCYDQNKRADAWHAYLAATFPGQTQSDLTPAEWGQVEIAGALVIAAKLLPF